MIYNDVPINSIDEDYLNRKPFITQLKNIIEDYDKKNSLTIGLEGSWGSGKTSLLNILSKELQNKKMKIVNFNPWNYNENQNMQEIFFNELHSQIEKPDTISNIHEKIKKYQYIISPTLNISSALIQATTCLPTDIIKNEVSKKLFNSDSPSILDLKESLNEELNKLEYKIIIIIDDIDRLTDDNIRTIFNLTASVANFDNIIYVIAYDKQVVLNALEESQSYSSEKYLEKIIQLPITIPKITDEEIKAIFAIHIQKIIEKSLISEEDIHSLTNYIDLMSNYFGNIRDIKRYINLLLLYLPVVKNEVDIIDFMLITLIQIFENEIYHLIKNNSKFLLYGKNTMKISDEYELFYKENTGFYKVLYDYFKNNEKLKLLLFNLFPKLKEIYEKNNIDSPNNMYIKRLICCPDYFDNYFIYGVSELDISETEIDKMFEYDTNKLIEEFTKYLHLNMREILIKKLRYRSKSYDTKHSKKLIKVMLLTSDKFNYYPDTTFLILDYLRNLDKNERYIFVKDIIKEFPFNFGTFNLIYHEYYNHTNNNNGFLDKKQLKDILEMYLKKLNIYDINEILDNAHCYDLLSCLKIMSDEKYFNNFINKCISNKGNLFKFIQCFNREGYENIFDIISMRDNEVKCKKRFDYENMCNIIDVNILKKKLNEIKDDKLNDEEKELKNLFFKEYNKEQ